MPSFKNLNYIFFAGNCLNKLFHWLIVVLSPDGGAKNYPTVFTLDLAFQGWPFFLFVYLQIKTYKNIKYKYLSL